jgi:hypothetical protein
MPMVGSVQYVSDWIGWSYPFDAVRERGRRRLVHHANHIEPGDGSGILGRLSLLVVEVGRDRDYGMANPIDHQMSMPTEETDGGRQEIGKSIKRGKKNVGEG